MDVSSGWWWSLGAATALGGVAGAWLMHKVAQFRHSRDLQRATDTLKKQNATLAEQLRSAQARTQIELEQLRQSHKRQRAPAEGASDVAERPAEQRLIAAYDELDRMRGNHSADPDTGSAELSDGFAATRPMRDGM